MRRFELIAPCHFGMEAVLKNAGDTVRDHMMMTKPNPRCEQLHPKLMELYQGALERYSAMLEELIAHIEEGKPLGEAFDPIFG